MTGVYSWDSWHTIYGSVMGMVMPKETPFTWFTLWWSPEAWPSVVPLWRVAYTSNNPRRWLQLVDSSLTSLLVARKIPNKPLVWVHIYIYIYYIYHIYIYIIHQSTMGFNFSHDLRAGPKPGSILEMSLIAKPWYLGRTIWHLELPR